MGFAASFMTTSCVYKLAAPVYVESAITHSTWLDTRRLMSESYIFQVRSWEQCDAGVRTRGEKGGYGGRSGKQGNQSLI